MPPASPPKIAQPLLSVASGETVVGPLRRRGHAGQADGAPARVGVAVTISEPPSAGVTRPWTTPAARPSLLGDQVTVEVVATSSAVVVVGPVVHERRADVPEMNWLFEVIV